MSETHQPGDELKEAVSTAVISKTGPLGRTGLSTHDLSAALGDNVVPADVREILDATGWAYRRDDEGYEWIFDRHVVFAESIDDVIDSYPDRYEESDFR